MTAVLGVAVSTLSSGCSAVGNVLLKVSHNHNETLPAEEQKAMMMRFHTYPIISLYVCNGLLDTVAFALAPISLLAPTSTVTIVINIFTAYLLLGEVVNYISIMGSVVIICGAVVCTIFGSKESKQRTADELVDLYSREGFLVYAFLDVVLLITCAILALWALPAYFSDVDAEAKAAILVLENPALKDCPSSPQLSPRYKDPVKIDGETDKSSAANVTEINLDILAESSKSNNGHGDTDGSKKDDGEEEESNVQQELAFELSYRRREKSVWLFGLWAVSFATLNSGVGTWTNILLKSGVEMISASIKGDNQLNKPMFWLFIVACTIAATSQLVMTAKMMCTFPAIFIIPIYQCIFTISLIVGGGTYFDEFSGSSTLELVFFGVGCAVCFSGIAIITSQDKTSDQKVDLRNSQDVLEEAPADKEEVPTDKEQVGVPAAEQVADKELCPALSRSCSCGTVEFKPQECTVPDGH